MSHHKRPPPVMRIFIACSPDYHNRRAIMEAVGSIFLDTIEQQRQYYYFDCPAMNDIFEDGIVNRAIFQLVPNDGDGSASLRTFGFSYIVAGGDEAFVTKILSEVGSSDAVVVRLA